MTPFYEWLLSGGYFIWYFVSYGLTFILGAVTTIVLPIIFYKNAPKKNAERAFLSPMGEFFLNQQLSQYFSSIRLEGENIVFYVREGINDIDLSLAVYCKGKFKKTMLVSNKQPCGGFSVKAKYNMIDSIVVVVNKVNGQATKAPSFGKMAVKNILWILLTGVSFMIITIMFANYYSIFLNKYISAVGWIPQFNILFYVGIVGFIIAPVAILVENLLAKAGGSKK